MRTETVDYHLMIEEIVRANRNIGLLVGEMTADAFYATTLDPANRILKRITIEDAMLAETRFNELMGASVPPRRKFIEENAYRANIDV